MGFAWNEMRKLQESENHQQIHLAPRIEEKSSQELSVDLCKEECGDAVAEVERLRELAVEQQEIIEVLRQAVKEKERKLDQLLNKKRKEEFYRQWLELEPVAEVDDEEEHEEGDSALSSAPSSLSPQPGGCGQWQTNGITREAYEAVLLEVEELQAKLLQEQQELSHAKSQVRDLEKALLQETRGSQNSRRVLSDKLREAQERETALAAEISELREQNELLEFRVLELEELPNLRDTPDLADSGIVSPEPIHLYKDHLNNKHRDRAVATVIPYMTTYTQQSVSPIPHKAPLSLQESGIFVEEEEGEEEMEEQDDTEEEKVKKEEEDTQKQNEDMQREQEQGKLRNKVTLTSRDTQTEAPVGELLQEVQRLQELRARIQERATKVLPVSAACEQKSCFPMTEISGDPALDEQVHQQQAFYQERIRELEERLATYEATEEKRMQERRLSKEREDELLDENYRLTERLYLLENDLRRRAAASQNCSNDGNDDNNDDDDNNAQEKELSVVVEERQTCEENEDCSCSRCSRLHEDCERRINQLSNVEAHLQDQIASLERRERTLIETLRQANVTWSKLELNFNKKHKELQERLDAQMQMNRALIEHLAILNKRKGLFSSEDEVDGIARTSSTWSESTIEKNYVGESEEEDGGIQIVSLSSKEEKKEESLGQLIPVMMEEQKNLDNNDDNNTSKHSSESHKRFIQSTPSYGINNDPGDTIATSNITYRSSSESSDTVVSLNHFNTVNIFSNAVNESRKDERTEKKKSNDNCDVMSQNTVKINQCNSVYHMSVTIKEEESEDREGKKGDVENTEAVTKVRRRRNRENEREGWGSKMWNIKSRAIESLRRDFFSARSRPLTVYQEICV